uniref:Ig-like domain-containing protein n=1 Tax=Sinocyclocheilus anshuiensis TaxID=1608454 RepID=A0A671SX32_9TELE
IMFYTLLLIITVVLYILDDIAVGYYDSETNSYIPRGNTTNEDEEVDFISYNIKEYLEPFILGRLTRRFENKTEGPVVYQMLSLCEVLENDKPGQLITKIAFEGSTTDEMRFFDGTITFQGIEKVTQLHLEMYKWRHSTIHYPRCTMSLRKYLKKRQTQGKRKVKPRIRLIQKNSDSGGFRVSCLATGFYPRHINLTLFRDGQLVSDHEITGGDLLPNGDGTYQMRKSLEIRAADKHKYTCSATHLSLDNKLDVTLEFDHGEPFKSVIPSVLTVLALMLAFGAAAAITAWKRQPSGRSATEFL